MTRLTTLADPEAVAERAASEIARRLASAKRERGVAHLALSGGTTPGRTYELLAGELPMRAGLEDWQDVEIWFADERCVDKDDPESNYKLAFETFLDPTGIPDERVHRMEGELGPEQGATGYEQALRERVSGRDGDLPVLDAIVLGIGPDGHVASLFPGAPTLEAGEEAVCLGVHDSPKPPPDRITLSLGVLRAARRCLLLATGASKADAVAAMLGEPTRHVPASLLARDKLSVILDDAAAPPGPLARG
ncbi:MAG TPA: 6-phosphogluconolactonase [Solirubrobacteraceae bacterium]|nr:6-phosphogluconolactonase [Solirubrobacteraceae bacterium]